MTSSQTLLAVVHVSSQVRAVVLQCHVCTTPTASVGTCRCRIIDILAQVLLR